MAISRIGFGQVEPNHMSNKRTGQIYAQLPAAKEIDILENGQFVKYDYADGVCAPDSLSSTYTNVEKVEEWMMVYNEIKLYDEREQMYKDFAMIKDNYTPGSDTITHEGLGPFAGQMVPRVVKTNIGDIFTTNTLEKGNTSNKAVVEMKDYAVGDILKINSEGFLSASGTSNMEFQVVKVYTLPDGQAAVKVMRIK